MTLHRDCTTETFPVPSAIAFLEFTNLGPTLRQQSPQGYLTREQIFKIHNFVFPPASLFDKTLTLLYEDKKMIGHPKCIEGEQYVRNQYSFNVLLCFDGDLDIHPYQAILKKIVNEFSVYEIEESYLNNQYDSNAFQFVLDKILEGLQIHGEVNLGITNSNCLFLKLIPTNICNMEPIDHRSVPVLNHNIRDISPTELDLTIKEVLSHMDEIRPLTLLAKDCNVTLKELATDVSRHLQYFNIVKGYVPLFQYSNAYLISPKISLLLNNTEFQRKMITYLKKDFDLYQFCINDIIKLFLSLKHAQSLYQLYRLELNEMHLLAQTGLIRRIIEFGIFNKLIIPLKEYLYVTPTPGGRISGLLGRNDEFVEVDALCWSQGGIHRDFALQILEENEYTTLFV